MYHASSEGSIVPGDAPSTDGDKESPQIEIQDLIH